jgi:hypothetical protein
MTPLFTVMALSVPASAADGDTYAWDWSREHRFFLQSEVRLPLYMWIATPYNRQARITSFDLRLVTTCGDAEENTRRTVEVLCTLDDVAFSAAPFPPDEGLVQEIVTVLDEALTGATVQLQMHEDGRVTNIDLEGLVRRTQRMAVINENLRLIVSRAFAGLDLQLPTEDGGAWPQYQSWLMRAPAIDGSSGASEIVHREVDRDAAFATITSAGRGLIVPGEGLNKFDARMTSEAAFDVRSGRLADRTWSVIGGPTASSFIALGTEGYPYVQQGRLVALSGQETWDLGESVELPPQDGQSAIQPGVMGGPTPR